MFEIRDIPFETNSIRNSHFLLLQFSPPNRVQYHSHALRFEFSQKKARGKIRSTVRVRSEILKFVRARTTFCWKTLLH